MTNEEKKLLIRKQAHELLDIVLDANGLEDRSQEKTGNKPTVFFRYSGHVNEMEMSLYKDGWSAMRSARPDIAWTFYLDEPLDEMTISHIREEACDDTV